MKNNQKSCECQTVLTHSAPLWNLPAHTARCLEAILYLEMASIKYHRKICKYNINYFAAESYSLPIFRHNIETTRNTVEFCEGSKIIGKNNRLNSDLQFTQQADVSALQSLIRDRLHLVFLHQLYANNDNWNEYCKEMGRYLPLLLRRFLLNKEREHVLKQLTRNQIITEQNAKELLNDCLHVIYTKMAQIKTNEKINDKINEKTNEIEYFFGSQPTSLDAVLCSELVLLECSQLPHKYLDFIKDNPKIQNLLKYTKSIMDYYHQSIITKLINQNQIQPIQILNQPKQFNNKNKNIHTQKFYSKLVDTQDKQNSMIFVVASIAAFALYWKFTNGTKQNMK